MRLYTKILLWFFLNLVVLGAGFYLVFRLQFQFGLDSLLMGQAGERIQALSEVINSELKTTSETNWNQVLERFSQAYHVQFFLFRGDGSQVAGESVSLPDDVLSRVAERRGMGLGRGPPPGRGPNRALDSALPEARTRFVEHTSNPTRYWIGVSLPLPEGERRWGRALLLLAMAKSLHSGGLFFDLRPWMVVGFGALLFSVLFWFPLVRGITRSISQVTQATEQIAQGNFETRLALRRRDELGRLGQAVNAMAARLSGFVTGQKRFLGDIAHELCSPIARIQVALGILEERPEQKTEYLKDLHEDVQQMSNLVNELLSFSKAALQHGGIQLTPLDLSKLASQVAAREGSATDQIVLQIEPGLQVLAEPELLSRALGNLLRNAIRYAGTTGPITVTAKEETGQICLKVVDHGPGIPEDNLQQIFDPFFRVESSRSRETGGVGLGLAIVKTCVEACQGTVTARNHPPSGLEVRICLKTPPKTSLPAAADDTPSETAPKPF